MAAARGRQFSDVRAGGRRGPARPRPGPRSTAGSRPSTLHRARVSGEFDGKTARWPGTCVPAPLCRERLAARVDSP